MTQIALHSLNTQKKWMQKNKALWEDLVIFSGMDDGSKKILMSNEYWNFTNPNW